MFKFKPTHQEILILPQSKDENARHILIQREVDADGAELFSVKVPMDAPRQMEVRLMNKGELKEFLLDHLFTMLTKYPLEAE